MNKCQLGHACADYVFSRERDLGYPFALNSNTGLAFWVFEFRFLLFVVTFSVRIQLSYECQVIIGRGNRSNIAMEFWNFVFGPFFCHITAKS